MTFRNLGSRLTLALSLAAIAIPVSGNVLAGGYGYGGHSGWSGYQNHAARHQPAQKFVYVGGNRHLAWCYNRYRSYRLTDNSFQPNQGPRKECLSPYEQDRRALFVGFPDQAPEIMFRAQAETGQDQSVRDPFGYLAENSQAVAASASGNSADLDRFGNLPEQAIPGGEAILPRNLPTAGPGNRPIKVPQLVVTPRKAAAAPDVEPVGARPGSTEIRAERGQDEAARTFVQKNDAAEIAVAADPLVQPDEAQIDGAKSN